MSTEETEVVIMTKKPDKAPHLIMNAVLITSLFGSIINSTILGISAAKESLHTTENHGKKRFKKVTEELLDELDKHQQSDSTKRNTKWGVNIFEGQWMIGEVCCQLYALLSFTLVSGALWLTALAAVERWYKLVALEDYMSTFSEINTKILIKGVLMMAFGLCTGPLYGWGEYSYFKGLIELSGHVILPNRNATNEIANEAEIPLLCQRLKNNTDTMIIDKLTDSVKLYMENSMHFRVRSTVPNCVLGEMTLVMRALHSEALNALEKLYINGVLENNLQKTVALNFNGILDGRQPIRFRVLVNESEMSVYKTIYLSFQELGVCTLDISPVNTHVLSSTAYIFITTVVFPFAIIMYCGLHVLFRFHTGSNSQCYNDLRYLKMVYICGLFSIIMCVPYYVINILNSNGSIVSTVTNFVCTFLFYNSSLCISVPYIIYRFPRITLRKNGFPMRTFSGGINEIRRDSHGISAMSEYV